LDLSQAQTHLAAFVRDMRAGAADPVAMLQKHFPELGTAEESLEKLWTLSVAKLSSADRYAGLSTVDTDQSLERLLRFELPPEREGQPSETLRLDDFARFVKRPTCRKLLAGKARALVELSTKANPLFRPVIAEYQDVAARLARGKTSGVQRRLKAAALYRAELLKRVDQIADYLNWMEATQMSTRSHAFDAYFEALRERDAAPFRADPITKYMNLVEAITR
jgi:hypothetical protein